MAFDVARAPYLITRVYPWSDVVRAVRAACVFCLIVRALGRGCGTANSIGFAASRCRL